MASVTMGLRRRVPSNVCLASNAASPSLSTTTATNTLSTATTTATTTTNKRSRSENNNSPSHGNLNCSLNGGNRQCEPPTKKSRSSATSFSKSSAAVGGESSTNHSSGSKSRGNSAKNGSMGKRDGNSSSSTSSSGSNSSSSSNSNTTNAAVPTLPPSSPTSWQGSPNTARSLYSSVTLTTLSSSQSTTTNSTCLNAAAAAAAALNASTIPYMAPSVTPASMATFVGNATNLNKNSSTVSYLDISNMTGSSASYGSNNKTNGSQLPSKNGTGTGFKVAAATTPETSAKKFQNDVMFNAYQPWVIKTYGDLAKTKTITIKKYARILRTLRGEEANSAENSKFRFWVKSKGFHIGQPEGYDAKPADSIIGRHAVTSPGLDPPLYVPTQPPHNKALNGAEGTVPPVRVYKKVAIVENFFDIIHAVHVDLEGRPGKHAGQKRTYRTITETYAFLPREAVTRFLLGCTECQRRPRTPSPTNLSAQTPLATSATPPSPTPATTLSASTVQAASQRPREASHAPESKGLFNYRHAKYQKASAAVKIERETSPANNTKDHEEKYNPLSITNLLKKETLSSTTTTTTTSTFTGAATTTATITTTTTPTATTTTTTSDNLAESRRTPESDRASSRSSASSKRRRMLPDRRSPSPQPSQPLPRPWSPSVDSKNTPIDYSLPITTTYLKHQQRLLAEKSKAAKICEPEAEVLRDNESVVDAAESMERERFSPTAGLIDTNLNLLATIQHLHCQVMLALTERLRPAVLPASLVLPRAASILGVSTLHPGYSIPSVVHQNHS